MEVLNTRGRGLLLAKPQTILYIKTHGEVDVWSGGSGRSTTESELGHVNIAPGLSSLLSRSLVTSLVMTTLRVYLSRTFYTRIGHLAVSRFSDHR